MRSLLAVSVVFLGCGPTSSGGFATPTPTPPRIDPDTLCGTEGATRCRDRRFQSCVDGEWTVGLACDTPTPQCDAVLGCVACPSGLDYCVDRAVWSCSDDGTVATFLSECGVTETCLAGQCYDACAAAESQYSYLGCSFLAAPTANLLPTGFSDDFAVVVGNPSDVPAEIAIRHRGAAFDVVEVPPQDTLAITLPFHEALGSPGPSARVPDGAFELRSTIPVTAYQYNPLHFAQGANYSYTNDASMLLPEHVLTGDYIVSAWPSWGIGESPALTFEWVPGFFAVVATTNNTQVTINSSAATVDGVPEALLPGEESTVTLDRGDVLQVFSHQPSEPLTNACQSLGGVGSTVGTQEYCLSVRDGDLTGTRIAATAPIAVFAGHTCTFVPYDEWACDHLEEMMFPLQTWGLEIAVSAPTYPGGEVRAPTIVRIIAASDDTTLSFAPAVQPPQIIDAGAIVQFETDEHFVVSASGPIFVTQTMLGQQALGAELGDPAMGSGIPRSQWRSSYDFLTPDSYSANHLNVVAATGSRVFLDGAELLTWEAIGTTALRAARLSIEPGPHHIEGVDDARFAITAYGYAPFTSYLHPGGLNLSR